MAELADAADSKSAEGNLVGVRPPLPAPIESVSFSFLAPLEPPHLCSNYARIRKVRARTHHRHPRPKSSGARSRAARPADTSLNDGWARPVLSLSSCPLMSPAFAHCGDRFLRFSESIRQFDRKVVRLHDATRSNSASVESKRPCLSKEQAVMATAPTLTRRLLRTKQAPAYLSMSEWKLRRLIQNAIFPIVQDHEGGPFLLDVRDLDAYIEGKQTSCC
jgi:hypothetical protein